MDLGAFLVVLQQQAKLRDHQDQLESHEAGIDHVLLKIRDLNSRLLMLTWTCETLCNLLIEKVGIGEEDLKEMIRQQQENSIRLNSTCPACGHRFHENRTTCLYCGFASGTARVE